MKNKAQYNNKCIRCNGEFIAKKKTTLHCNRKCSNKTRRYKKIIESGIENEDYIICKWNNIPVGKYMSQYIKDNLPGKTIEDYQNEFPDALISAPAYIEKISKNSGKHMKLDKYKEMFSEKIKGKNNPNHKSNTTVLERQLCSKYSKEYWYKNFPELNETEVQNKVTEFALKSQINRLTETQLEYWINKGYNEVDAKEKLKERQTTFSKDICIEKFGEKEGLKRFNERQEKWTKSYKKSNFSRISQELFHSLYEHIKNEHKEIYYAELKNNKVDTSGRNNEYRLKLDNRIILPDLFIPKLKKIIEFDGAYWHNNKIIKNTNKTRDQIRDQDIERNGYEVYHVKELEYRKDPDKIIKKCVEFINS